MYNPSIINTKIVILIILYMAGFHDIFSGGYKFQDSMHRWEGGMGGDLMVG